MKYLFVFLLYALSSNVPVFAQDSITPRVSTPNISQGNDIFTKTSPTIQLVGGTIDLVGGGLAYFTLDSPQFRAVQRAFDRHQKILGNLKNEKLKWDRKLNEEGENLNKLQELQKDRAAQLKTEDDIINTKTAALRDAEQTLTSDQKVIKEKEIKETMVKLHSEATYLHRSHVQTGDDILDSLSSVEKDEYLRLREELNRIFKMKDVTQAEKDENILAAERELKTAQKAKSNVLDGMRDVQKQISKKADEINQIRPRVNEAGSLIASQETNMNAAQLALDAAKGARGGVRRYLSFGFIGRGLVLVLTASDFVGRFTYYFIDKEDPDYVPVFRWIKKMTPGG
jgi:hypothetical protein